VFTFMPTSSPKLVKLLCFYKCPCFTLVLSPLLLGVDFGFSLALFWGCLRLILCVFNCFIESFEPSMMRLNMFFTYLLIELFEIQWMSSYGSFSFYYHVGVCIIFEKVVQVSKRFMPP